jgi:hypothetical protein
MTHKEIDIDADEEGIYTADDVYGATSDFWGGSEQQENTEDTTSLSSEDSRLSSELQVEMPEC